MDVGGRRDDDYAASSVPNEVEGADDERPAKASVVRSQQELEQLGSLAAQGWGGKTGESGRPDSPPRQAHDLPSLVGTASGITDGYLRTPLYSAQNAERYARQQLIRRYEDLTQSRLIVMIDTVFAESVTYLEEVLRDTDPAQPLHLLLASPGGDGEVAVRLVRAMQARCSELVIVVPDMAKSAATIMCLGANRILMAPSSDLGPIDPQFRMGGSLFGAKELEAAVQSADQRVQAAPDTYPLYSGLLADVTMLMLETARSSMRRSYSLMEDAVECVLDDPEARSQLIQRLKGPLLDEAQGHLTTIGPNAAQTLGLPVEIADTDSEQWQIIWALWTRYFSLGCFPAGTVAIYENARASQVIGGA
jgi:hypothetical protein